MKFNIREMTIDDYDRVFQLWSKTEGIGVSDADSREGIQSYLDRNTGLSLIAELKEELVATILAGTDGRRGYIQHLCVKKDYRNIGIGTCLLERTKKQFLKIGIEQLRLFVFADNIEGQRYWAGRGWILRDDIRAMALDLRG